MDKVAFQTLSPSERIDALLDVQAESGRRAFLLEKDIWLVRILDVLFNGPFGADIVFKGGTSLSKAYHAINRFSEDVDVTYDIRSIASDLINSTDDEVIPTSRSQSKKWTDTIRKRLVEWIKDVALVVVRDGLFEDAHNVSIDVSGDRLLVRYESELDDIGFGRPEVIIEFGARATGEPNERRTVVCDAATYLPEFQFPTASPRVMLAERTFWEKATAIHVFCAQQRLKGARLSRHWHDLVRLDEAGFAKRAMHDRLLAESVARHKAAFFRERDVDGSWIDYTRAVTGELRLVPFGPARTALEQDYKKMVDDGMLFGNADSFGVLIDGCQELERRANEISSR